MNFSELRHIKVSNMMQGNKKAVLLHANKQYLLSITRRGKLILTVAESKTEQNKTVPSGDIEPILS